MKRHFSNWLQAFMGSTAHLEAPLHFYFWTGVSTIAGALRRCVWIDQGDFQWTPNFYILLVAPPGVVSKSTTIDIGMNLLRKVPGINFGPDVVTWQALVQALAKACEEVLMKGDPLSPNVERVPMSAITISSSEFGTFLNPNDRDMVDLLVTLWDSRKGALKKLTKTQGSDEIINPWINLNACTTPAWLEGNVPEYLVGGGLFSRIIPLYAERKRQTVAYPKLALPPDFKETRQKLIEDLVAISTLRGEFEILPDALEWGIKWYEDLQTNRPKHLDNYRFGGYIARKQTHIHKLAMVLSAAQRDNLIITRDDLESANRIVTSLEGDMPKVFEKIGTNPQSRGQAELVSIVRAHHIISVRDLYKQLFRIMSFEDFRSAASSAVSAGLIVEENVGGEICLKATYHGKSTQTDTDRVIEFGSRTSTGGSGGTN